MLICPKLADIRKSIASCEGSQALPACASDKSNIENKMIRGIGGMILKTERRKPNCSNTTCPSVIASTTNLTWTGLGWNYDLRAETPVTNILSHDTASLKTKVGLHYK
jgi:hypothetical protein